MLCCVVVEFRGILDEEEREGKGRRGKKERES